MTSYPDRLYIDKKDRDIYARVSKAEVLLQFTGDGGDRTRKEQFLFALAVGFFNQVRTPLVSPDGLILTKDLRQEDLALINSVALSVTGSPDVVLDQPRVFRIAEEYAHAGIDLLDKWMKQTSLGSFEKEFEIFIRDLCTSSNKKQR